ncbi:MAG: T9SS type A sorting domain-containing protein [Bacteroidales bacterium]|nr:T9SS type A sorting domain-containing protein [Bacteroidales bacterium]
MRKIFLKIWCCVFVLSIGLAHKAVAQEGVELRDLQINSVLINAKKTPARKSVTPLTLPFFDDFSSLHSPYPNPELWQDNMVFINTSFPLFPPTIGVATFDAFDANGRLYSHDITNSFSADTLTSQPIRLDSIFSPFPRQLQISDSIYFSFYYQPGGGFGNAWDGTLRGRAPRRNDKFILEFLVRPQSGLLEWAEVWSTEGENLETFCPLCPTDAADNLKTFFKQVLIPINATIYLHDNFQFRFRNISSLTKPQNDPRPHSGGQWHLDYVRLDRNRSANDVFSNDFAFVERAERVLKDFQAMPAKQFQAATDLVNHIPLLFRNLDHTDQLAAEYKYRIFNQIGEVVWQSDSGRTPNISPFYTHGFNSDPDTISKPLLEYKFPNISNPETFTIQHILKRAGQDICATNDTMEHTVHFGNFYAYDDGTSEVGFGFSGPNARNSQFAYRFPMRVPDTLVAIQIWFNHTSEDMNRAWLNLAVWSAENDSTPSVQERYVGERFVPTYNETIGYQTYALDQPVVLPQGSFFIGFQQQSDDFLNIGFDQNNNAENRMFFRTTADGQWEPIFYYGSVMMRPVFGTLTPTGFCERGVAEEKISVFPNPSNGTIFVESLENVVIGWEIYDLSGKRLLQKTCRETQFSINLPERTGIYILLLHTEKGLVSKKIIRR